MKEYIESNADRYASSVQRDSSVIDDSSCDEPVALGKVDNPKENRVSVYIDFDCDDELDSELWVPYDENEALMLAIENTMDENIHEIVIDSNWDDKRVFSLVDVNADGEPDLIGSHPDGSIVASRYEKYTVLMD